MHNSAKITRVNPADINSLKYEFARFKSNCTDYGNVSKEEFLKCRNSIYIISSKLNKYKDDIYAIIGVKRSELSETTVDALKYYCNPTNINDINLVYVVNFLHFNSISKISTEFSSYFIKELFKYSLADKNDGFVIFRKECNIITYNYIDALNCVGFELYDTDNDGISTYIKPPTVCV